MRRQAGQCGVKIEASLHRCLPVGKTGRHLSDPAAGSKRGGKPLGAKGPHKIRQRRCGHVFCGAFCTVFCGVFCGGGRLIAAPQPDEAGDSTGCGLPPAGRVGLVLLHGAGKGERLGTQSGGQWRRRGQQCLEPGQIADIKPGLCQFAQNRHPLRRIAAIKIGRIHGIHRTKAGLRQRQPGCP